MARKPANMSCAHCGGTLIPSHELCDYCQSANPYYEAPRVHIEVPTAAYTPAATYTIVTESLYTRTDTFGRVVIWLQCLVALGVTLLLCRGRWLAYGYLATGEIGRGYFIPLLLWGTLCLTWCIGAFLTPDQKARGYLTWIGFLYFFVTGIWMTIHIRSYQLF